MLQIETVIAIVDSGELIIVFKKSLLLIVILSSLTQSNILGTGGTEEKPSTSSSEWWSKVRRNVGNSISGAGNAAAHSASSFGKGVANKFGRKKGASKKNLLPKPEAGTVAPEKPGEIIGAAQGSSPEAPNDFTDNESAGTGPVDDASGAATNPPDTGDAGSDECKDGAEEGLMQTLVPSPATNPTDTGDTGSKVQDPQYVGFSEDDNTEDDDTDEDQLGAPAGAPEDQKSILISKIIRGFLVRQRMRKELVAADKTPVKNTLEQSAFEPLLTDENGNPTEKNDDGFSQKTKLLLAGGAIVIGLVAIVAHNFEKNRNQTADGEESASDSPEVTPATAA